MIHWHFQLDGPVFQGLCGVLVLPVLEQLLKGWTLTKVINLYPVRTEAGIYNGEQLSFI